METIEKEEVLPTEEVLPHDLRPQHFSNLWTMFYRHGMNANLSKNFYYDGKIFEAKKRAQDHCRIMGYKFIFLRPLVCNLEEEEEYKLKGSSEGEFVP